MYAVIIQARSGYFIFIRQENGQLTSFETEQEAKAFIKEFTLKYAMLLSTEGGTA